MTKECSPAETACLSHNSLFIKTYIETLTLLRPRALNYSMMNCVPIGLPWRSLLKPPEHRLETCKYLPPTPAFWDTKTLPSQGSLYSVELRNLALLDQQVFWRSLQSWQWSILRANRKREMGSVSCSNLAAVWLSRSDKAQSQCVDAARGVLLQSGGEAKEVWNLDETMRLS